MKFYLVTKDVLRLGPGQVVAISDLQRKPRAHNLDVVEDDKGPLITAKGKIGLEFKVGETLGIDAVTRVQEAQVSEINKEDVLADIRERAKKHDAALAKLKADARARAAAAQRAPVKAA